MPDRPPLGVKRDFEETNMTSAKDSHIGAEQEASPFRQFIGNFEEALVALLLYAILLSAVLQSLFRDELLAWLRSILERTY